jgi:cytochrome c5
MYTINIDGLQSIIMQCAVYDTYVTKKDGRLMHFDVIVESSTPHEKAVQYGKEYLKSAGQEGQKISQEECQFCHVQEAPKIVEDSINQNGYFIQKMEGCS